MTLDYTSTPDLGVYSNNNYITVASSATAVEINLASGATFDSPPSLASIGLSYVTGGNPEYITGNPSGAYGGPFTINTLSPDEALILEVVEPTFTTTPITGSVRVTVQDTMVINNPALSGRGRITYYIQIDDTWINVGYVSLGDSLELNGCTYDFGIFPLRAVYTVRLIPNCGGTSPLILEATYESTIEFVEYRPQMNLSSESGASCAGTGCCGATIDQDVTVYPNFNTNQDSGDSTITFTLYDFEGTQIGSPTVITFPNADPGSVDTTFTFTPSAKGDYRVVVSLDNGYAVCEKEIIISACDYLTISKDPDTCALYTLSNCSLANDHTYTLFLSDGTVVGTVALPLLAGATANITVPGDGIYYVVIYDDEDNISANFVIASYCDILECLTSKFNGVLCEPCSCEGSNKKRWELTRILPTAYLFFSYVHKEYELNSIYTVLDGAKVIELQTIQSVLDKLTEFCDDCSSGNSDCGCTS